MKTRILLLSTCLVASSFLLTNCATIIKGSKQQVAISSNPSNATITINGQSFGKTPTIVKLMRQDRHHVKIELEGYKPYEVNLNRQMNGWIFGNLIVGGLLGICIDVATGAMYSLTPNQVNGQFHVAQGASKMNDNIYFGVVLEADPSWTKIGSLEKVNN